MAEAPWPISSTRHHRLSVAVPTHKLTPPPFTHHRPAQVLDNSTTFLETSVTAFALFSLARGALAGHLPAGPGSPVDVAIRRAWPALAARVAADGTVELICMVRRTLGDGTCCWWCCGLRCSWYFANLCRPAYSRRTSRVRCGRTAAPVSAAERGGAAPCVAPMVPSRPAAVPGLAARATSPPPVPSSCTAGHGDHGGR